MWAISILNGQKRELMFLILAGQTWQISSRQGGLENGLNTHQELYLKENKHLMTSAESTTIELVRRMDNNSTPKNIL